MCDYCSSKNTDENLRGEDGVYYDRKKSKHYLYIEHFFKEIYRLEVNYCPECGRKL